MKNTFLNFLILDETHLSQPPLEAFLLKIKTPAQAQRSSWKQNLFFKGFLVDVDENTMNSGLWPAGEMYYLNILIQKGKNIDLVCSFINAVKPVKCFFHVHDLTKVRLLHKFVSSLKERVKNDKLFDEIYPLDLNWGEFNHWNSLDIFGSPLCENQASDSIKYSVVIPHFETPYFTANVIRHLELCEEVKSAEILIVDDGSKKQSVDYLTNFLSRHCRHISWKFFKWPEDHKNNKNEKIFRAGASRNWGASYAQGKFLIFLDSDILVPSHFFSEVEKSLEQAEVVQFKRQHIPPKFSGELSQYLHLSNNFELYIEESSYWDPFFRTHDWMALEQFWKYTCTYTLAVRKEHFHSVGGLRRNFIDYGFEDTDLGLRLARRNFKFHLNKTPVLHLTSKVENTQTLWFRLKKMRRIKKMAQVFYLLNPSNENYNLVRPFLD